MCPLTAGLLHASFTMPKEEYKPLAEVKRACLKAGIELKKTELLQANVALMRQMDLEKLKERLCALPCHTSVTELSSS